MFKVNIKFTQVKKDYGIGLVDFIVIYVLVPRRGLSGPVQRHNISERGDS